MLTAVEVTELGFFKYVRFCVNTNLFVYEIHV